MPFEKIFEVKTLDKYEYKLKLEQIKNLIEARDYTAAAKIADSINWKKVKSVSTLCMIGELYEKTKQLEESREILLMAYDRSPVGRNIIYRLTHVAIKMNHLDEAQEFYEEFLEIAPHDNMKYVLKYEIARAKGTALPELISILEEFKEREYTEEWAFELAFLYHKSGNAEKCVEICDELILWFGDGKYVEKALELKMLYQPLNKLQEEKYRSLKKRQEDGRFNTVNLQEELIKGMQQIREATEKETVNDTINNIKKMVGEAPLFHGTKPEEEKVTEDAAGEAAEEAAGEGSKEKRPAEEKLSEELSEEFDGQLSMRVPEAPRQESQITGQMRIEDILAEWEKTKEAARAAIEEAEKRRLADIKTKALQEAENIMERLADVMPAELSEKEPTEEKAALTLGELMAEETGITPEEVAVAEERLMLKDVTAEKSVPEEAASEEAKIVLEEPVSEDTEASEVKITLEEPVSEDTEAAETRITLEEPVSEDTEAAETRITLEEPVSGEAKPALEDPESEKISSALEKLVAEEMGVMLEQSVEEEIPQVKLNAEQKKIFTYFTLIGGMEQQLCQTLEGVKQRKRGRKTSASGNLIIMGSQGSGKTVLATDFIKAYQKMAGRTGGKVGKISASVLNRKDVSKLMEAVGGGYLIIERAGDLSRESVDRLSGLMEQDTNGLMVILEDDKAGIEKVLSRNKDFTGKFTERLRIPVFTSDELVAFASAYAKEHNCQIDDMGILALYNSISNIQKLEEATTLTEVKEIMDRAIYRANRGGLKRLFGGKRTTEDGLTLIKEKDFDE